MISVLCWVSQSMNIVCFSISLGSATVRKGKSKNKIAVLGSFSNYIDKKVMKQHLVHCRCTLNIQ